MCEPTTIIAITGVVVGAVAKRRQAKKQFAAAKEGREAQAEEIAAKSGAKAGERVKQGRAERARLRVAAGESGVAGQSFEAQMLDSAFQEDQDLASIDQNTDFEQRGSESRFQSVLASVDNPSALATGLQIAGAGLSAHAAATARTAKIPAPVPPVVKIPTRSGGGPRGA